jgi:hypothetical protein
MKTNSPQFPDVFNWLDYLRYQYGYDVLSESLAQQLHEAVSRAERDLGAILGPDYAGVKALNMACRLGIRSMAHDPIDQWTGTIEARLIEIKKYADRQRLHFYYNELTNCYDSTPPKTYIPCLPSPGRVRNDEPATVFI